MKLVERMSCILYSRIMLHQMHKVSTGTHIASKFQKTPSSSEPNLHPKIILECSFGLKNGKVMGLAIWQGRGNLDGGGMPLRKLSFHLFGSTLVHEEEQDAKWKISHQIKLEKRLQGLNLKSVSWKINTQKRASCEDDLKKKNWDRGWRCDKYACVLVPRHRRGYFPLSNHCP